ncbi:hypothetical protein ACFYRL_06850 [Streptomyces goshikiensis]|uniref:hypothetical protein n=1 Tax=Streptomyces goshikiensis TaxID=1942 RepID=UPI00369986FB
MIASTPVARWSWGETGRETDLVREAVRRFFLALRVLDRYGLAAPHGGRVAVVVSEAGARSALLRAEFPVGAEAVEGLFALTTMVSEEYFHVGLTTFCDAWMPFDLRGRAQEAVFAANRPRLAAALAEIAEALDVEIDPEDATWFGFPTESGVENHYKDDGSASDVWGSFEIPYRNGIFSQTPRFTAGYGRRASGRVRCVPVLGSTEVLGYLWASDAEGAASFEPCDAADLDGYRAGLVWLDRLQEAYDRGLSPTAALVELGGNPGDRVAGRADVKATAEAGAWEAPESILSHLRASGPA